MKETDLPPEAQVLLEEVRDAGRRAMVQVSTTRGRLDELRAAAQQEIDDLERRRKALDELTRNRLSAGAVLGEAWAEYERAVAETQAAVLRLKSHPAKRTAGEVKSKGRDLAEARREARQARWLLAYYEDLFPWLVELRDEEAEREYVAEESLVEWDDTQDPARRWLTDEEFQKLSMAERSQLALDRWKVSRRGAWQAGRDYERYVGYLREAAGARVEYQGIVAGFDDLGRDLLARTGNRLEVVQCKRWAAHRTIHEKHVFQLFGTVTACRIDHPELEVTGTFTTTTRLSERARAFADQLEVRVEEQIPLADYPMAKCNVGRSGEPIYHLPFDQRYDNTRITPGTGDRWAWTAQEAEDVGYRRAKRWRGGAAV